MKKIYISFLLLFTITTVFSQLEGTTWKIAPTAQALAVGPAVGDFSWWSNSASDVDTRACFFDDTFVFNADGTFMNVQDGETWLEPWQGVDPEACGASVAPHDGSTAATWAYDADAGTVTITGQGAHLGLAKVINGGELTSPADAPASITYPVVLDGTTMTVDINFGPGFWHFVLEQVTETGGETGSESPVAGTWNVAPMAAALAVGPAIGDFSWWSNSADDVDTRACFFDDKFVFNNDGTFMNVQDGETWLEPWQGVDPEACGASLAPHDGSNPATWAFDEAASTITLTGVGAYLGLAKVFNGGELASPADAPASITYPVIIEDNTMTVDINFGPGYWHFVLQKDTGEEPAPVTTSNVTFGVDMNAFAGEFTQVNVSGSFNGWAGTANPLSDEDGDGIWTATIPLDDAKYEYKFTLDDWAVQEQFAGGEACTETFGDNGEFVNRVITVAGDAEVCFNWNSCDPCGTVAAPTSNVSFGVDMNGFAGEFTQVYVSGNFNGWAGDANPLSDEDNDGIWTGIIPLEDAKYEYKFTLDNWAVQEQFAGGEACTETFGDNGEFVNRVITVAGDSEVCFTWNTCDACGTGDGGGEEPMGIVGTWSVAPMAQALAVGPAIGDFSWWSNSASDVDTRACFFDDQFVFNADGTFMNVQDGETWLEPWQGVDPEACGASIAPHDGSNAATWTLDEAAGTLTLTGVGAHLGLAKVVNGAELASPADAPASITYPVVIEGNTMTVDINFGPGFWHFVLERQATSSTFEIADQALFNFFPNPANNQIQVQTEEAMDELSIHDFTGRILMTIAKPSTNETVDVSSLAKGLYIIQARVGNKISVEKLSIN